MLLKTPYNINYPQPGKSCQSGNINFNNPVCG